ncbi:hypothetical protein F4679DRAFT_592005 [Xylaria curta]|nr:hypothetical protein F4679DRAFT_592005 [Xylaria curta]
MDSPFFASQPIMNSSFLTSQPPSEATMKQFLQVAKDLSSDVIVGDGEKGYQLYSEGTWKLADMIVDNGLQQGYSVYYQYVPIGCGKLIIFDEIDKEMDTLYGGPVPSGWVTNFPNDYVAPPDHIIVRYQIEKRAFRKDFITWPWVNDPHAGEIVNGVYRLAASDPTAQFGLDETLVSQTTKFSVGFDGVYHRFPTITSDWNYYSELMSAENMLGYPCPPKDEGADDAASDSGSATPGTSSDGRYVWAGDSSCHTD